MITPILALDSKERWGPVAVERATEVPGVKVITSGGATLPFRSLADLPPTGGRINFPAEMKPVLERPGVGYHRVVKAGRLFWHQFWTFWLYNPKTYVGTGAHEGDWEFVQLGCTDEQGDSPVLATASQHHTGGKREFWRTVRRNDRPVFYVARDSHANYFTPTKDVEDVADGKGLVLDQVEWRPFGGWAGWPGRWGNSTGEGKSPESPGCQGHRWSAPHLFHGQAR